MQVVAAGFSKQHCVRYLRISRYLMQTQHTELPQLLNPNPVPGKV